MDTQQQRWNVGSMIVSILIIVILPQLAAILIAFLYGVLVGFQTRGDTEAIDLAVTQFTTSWIFIGTFLLITAAVIFWRTSGLARHSESNVIGQVGVVSGVVLVIRVSMALFSDSLSTFLIPNILEWLIIIGIAALSIHLTDKYAKEPEATMSA